MSYGLRRIYRDRVNIESFLSRVGVGEGRSFFLTLTFSDNVTEKREASRHWNRLLTLLRSSRYRRRAFGSDGSLVHSEFQYICVWERQRRGAWHLHLIGRVPGLSNTKLRRLLDLVLSVSGAPFGFYRLRWTSGSPESVARYLSKYLVKFREKGVRLVSYSRSVVRVVSSRFSFFGGRSASWRSRCSAIHKEFPSFKCFYHNSSFEDKLRAVEFFFDCRFEDFRDLLLRYACAPLVWFEWEVFAGRTLFD